MYGQLHRWVNMRMLNPNLKAVRVQDFWGTYGWDYLTEENAPRSIDLLCERIVYLARLRERIRGTNLCAAKIGFSGFRRSF